MWGARARMRRLQGARSVEVRPWEPYDSEWNNIGLTAGTIKGGQGDEGAPWVGFRT